MTTDWYPPYIGGAERQTELLSKELVRRHHQVTVATVWSERSPARELDAGVDVRRLKGWTSKLPASMFVDADWKRPHPPLPDPGMVLRLRSLIAETNPDIVHATGWIAQSTAVALAGSRVPLIISWREYGYTCAQRFMMQRGDQVCSGPAPVKCLDCGAHVYGRAKGVAMVGGVFAGASLLRRTVATSHVISSWVEGVVRRDFGGNDAGRGPEVTYIPDFVVARNPAQTDEDASGGTARDYLDRLPEEPFILFVGQLQANKGIYQLLAAYERLESPPPLVLMGAVAPGSPDKLPANVTLIENVPSAAVMAAWQRCLFGVAPSTWPETFCTVITEAMSKGKPMIASNFGGPVDLIQHEQTGFLLPPGDVDALTLAMQRLIAEPELRERLGRAALERVRLFTAEAVVPRFEALYARLAGDARRHRGAPPCEAGPVAV